ncbi:hypothetical protein [Granulicella sibirica]|uniref:Uncharacterized protein n=1 Tax=Granulicella sibirica TaxID=2479048 RepID=A0A4Q0SZD4_9BACT|nr:hypothetical protein [Granulicella sibirica]RXH56237.1 hypothetical protein GRAN_3094 [Granulicella sibirica]
MKRAIYWGTIVAGVVAAYMMYRRGESVGTIAKSTIFNPVGALVNEVQNVA